MARRSLRLRDVRKGASPFDEEAFRTLLRRYGEGGDPLLLDRLVRAAIPIIGEALSSYTGDLDADVQDEMVQNAAIAVMEAITKGLVDVDQGSAGAGLFRTKEMTTLLAIVYSADSVPDLHRSTDFVRIEMLIRARNLYCSTGSRTSPASERHRGVVQIKSVLPYRSRARIRTAVQYLYVDFETNPISRGSIYHSSSTAPPKAVDRS